MKILVGIPICDRMEYCFKELIKAVKEIDYPDYDILFVDNSKDKAFFNELKKIEGINILYDTTKEERNLFRLISSRNKILKYAKNNYNYVLMLDADVIIPKNIINELLKWNKDIVSGLYLRLKNDKLESNADRNITKEEFEEFKKEGKITQELEKEGYENILQSLTNEEIQEDKLFEVASASNGCMLLSREAFTKLKYGYLGYGLDDNYFFEKAKEKGFKIYCYPKVFCEHMISKDKFLGGKHHLER